MTAAELQAIVTALPPQAHQNIIRDPKGFLEQLGMMRRVSTPVDDSPSACDATTKSVSRMDRTEARVTRA